MTIIQAINMVDDTKSNTYTQRDKTRWLSRIDWRIKREIIDTHESETEVEYNGYDDDTPIDAMLLAPEPYDELYLRWLEAQIDYANGEFSKFNNSITMFNAAFSDFERWYNRTHKPIGKTRKFF